VSTRRPWLLLGAVAAGLLAMRAVAPFVAPPAGVGGGAPAPVATAARPATPATLAEATGTVLLLGAEDRLLGVDPDHRRVWPVSLPGGAAAGDGGLIQGDGVVVAVRGGVAYAVPGRPGRPAARLGPASYALASSRPGRAWLVEQTGDPDRWFRAREVALGRSGAARPAPTGAATATAPGALPLGQRQVTGTFGGLLVQVAGAGGGLAVWDPRTGRLSRRIAGAGAPAMVVASGRMAAWVEESALHLTDLTSGRDRVVLPPPGSDGFAAPGAFSPDGRMLASVTQAGFSTRPALALVAVDRASAVRVAGSDGALADRCSPCLAWAPAGDWVFFNRLGPGFAIGAYRLGRAQAVTVPVEVPGSLPPSLAAIRPE
jgi:hypothetical protein